MDTSRAADVSQAAYFRETLAHERQTASAELTHTRERLRELTEGDQVIGFRGMARARSRVRELERRMRELDRLIAALDRRFAARWSADR
jgi:polyhydroxyalkanoate synthesis regulator phasin